MPYTDFREYLVALKKAGELVDIDRPFALSDVGKALKQSYACEGPALMFNQNGSAFPLVGGIYSTRSKAALAFQTDSDNLFQLMLSRVDERIPPRQVTGRQPCQDEVITGDAIDITKFPIPVYAPKDGGQYITAGITVSKDPETGVPDIGHYRYMVVDKKTLSFLAVPKNRFAKNLAKHKRMGVKPVGALVIGVDPVLAYACQVQVSEDTNDWEVAGGLRQSPVDLTRCVSIDLDVPATAEVVIEFEVDLDNTYPEGPLGEHTGFYDGMALPQPAAKITAITHRKKPIFQALLTGKPVTENHILKQVPFEASVFKSLKRQFPTIERISLRASGSVSFYIVIAMRPRWAGEARQAILAAIAHHIRPKWVIAVDPDVDVDDSAEVEWAMAFRTRPERDVFVVPGTPLGGCDPSVPNPTSRPISELMSSAVGVDATYPIGERFPDVADVPGWRELHLPEINKKV